MNFILASGYLNLRFAAIIHCLRWTVGSERARVLGKGFSIHHTSHIEKNGKIAENCCWKSKKQTLQETAGGGGSWCNFHCSSFSCCRAQNVKKPIYPIGIHTHTHMNIWSEVKSLSCVRLFATPCTVAYHAPLSTGFSRQEYWSGLPFPSPKDLPNPGIKPQFPTL